MVEQRRVLVGVCGGIAAYKAVELVRALQQQGCEVRVTMTRAAQEFVQPLTFAAITGHRVFTDLWSDEAGTIEHIAQAQWAEALVIAPATANTLAKLAHGLADDFLSAAYLATEAPVVIAPAMNVNMWNHAATRANVLTLQQRGHCMVEPESGALACGMTGEGRLAETAVIMQAVLQQLEQSNAPSGAKAPYPVGLSMYLRPWAEAQGYQPAPFNADLCRGSLAGETVLITAGGTREAVDPVRYLGNRSSGRMGFALAAAARRRGARVVVVAGAVSVALPAGCEVVSVQTAAEMQAAVLERLPGATVVVMAAAVADFRVREVSVSKIQREGVLTLELEATEDIVRHVVQRRLPGTLVVAFAAEMGMDVQRAREKLRRKGADAIVLNDVGRAGVGFDSERNAVVFLTETESVGMAEASKGEIAEGIWDAVVGLRVQCMSHK